MSQMDELAKAPNAKGRTKREVFQQINKLAMEHANKLDVDEPPLVMPEPSKGSKTGNQD